MNAGQMVLYVSSLALLPIISSAQTTRCPPVTPKNETEALRMEAASNKQGCWQRDPKSGQLFFVGSGDYKPLIPPQPKTTPTKSAPKLDTVSALLRGKALEGKWISPANEDYPEDQLVTIVKRGEDEYEVQFGDPEAQKWLSHLVRKGDIYTARSVPPRGVRSCGPECTTEADGSYELSLKLIGGQLQGRVTLLERYTKDAKPVMSITLIRAR